ncbi:YjjG family noncanonical pyrimidine nucleotidase [Fusobacterium ulcerans]|uniref:YjjG family noncanonical pyrimidine nucleotidase n=1 Tax=Fusobacterium ulcerans TaxID=861 RepID=UPI00241F99C1|nr:YjjG family noncanonical pyrimidine nucleotidase [Fusobacterium ulcerans]
MKFDLVLFDIDGTLLDFDLAEKNALADTLNEYNFICNDEILNRYHEINIFYWKQLEKGLVDKKQLAYKRYKQLFSEYGIETDIDTFNFKYRNRLKEGAYLLDNAMEICQELHENKIKLGVASNGGNDIQIRRIKKIGLDKYLDYMFVSEEIGYNKPHKEYFEHIFQKIEDIPKKKIMMVGDSLTADIQGGKNAEIITCWYNPNGESSIENIKPDYEIKDLLELRKLVGIL